MNRESQNKLKFDRRLQNRLGWVSPEDFASEVETLGDSSENVAEDEGQAGQEAPDADGSLPSQ